MSAPKRLRHTQSPPQQKFCRYPENPIDRAARREFNRANYSVRFGRNHPVSSKQPSQGGRQMRNIRFTAILAALLFATGTPLSAQQGTSELAGKVTDDSGAVLPGVAIVVTNEATGVFRDVMTSAEGTYFVSQLV